MSFDTAGRTMMGTSPAEMVELISSIPNKPIAFGANCGTGAPDLLRTVQDFAKSSPNSILIAKGNAGIPRYVDGHILYDGTPELMAKYADHEGHVPSDEEVMEFMEQIDENGDMKLSKAEFVLFMLHNDDVVDETDSKVGQWRNHALEKVPW